MEYNVELADLVYFVKEETCLFIKTRRYFSVIVKLRISRIFCNQLLPKSLLFAQ